MTNHMQTKSSFRGTRCIFRETRGVFSSSCSKRSFWIHTADAAGSVGEGEVVVSVGISHLKVVEEYASAFPCGQGGNTITF